MVVFRGNGDVNVVGPVGSQEGDPDTGDAERATRRRPSGAVEVNEGILHLGQGTVTINGRKQ